MPPPLSESSPERLPRRALVTTLAVLGVLLVAVARAGAAVLPLSPAQTRTLTVTVHGAGQVTSDPAGLTCGPPAAGSATVSCTGSFGATATVRLRATASTGYAFAAWGHTCSSEPQCDVQMLGTNRTQDAYFRPRAELQLYAAGRGTLRVEPAGTDWRGEPVENVCPSSSADVSDAAGSCRFYFLPGTEVTVRAAAEAGKSFVGWSAVACPGTSPCTLRLEDDETSLVARFTPVDLRIAFSPNSTGRVTSEPAGIDCGAGGSPSACAATFPVGTRVTLRAHPAGAAIVRWQAGCTPVAADPFRCVATVADDPHWIGISLGVDEQAPVPPVVTVNFQVRRQGTGTVKGDEGIDCGDRCSARFRFNREVTLVAEEVTGWRFVRWEGACASETRCTLNVGPLTSIRAIFAEREALAAQVLAVSARGSRAARRIAVRVTVNQAATCRVSLLPLRSSRTLAARTYALRPGATTVQLVVPRRVAAGRYRVSVVLQDDEGNRQAFVRVVRLRR